MKTISIIFFALAAVTCATASAADSAHKMDDCCPQVATRLDQTNTLLAQMQADRRNESQPVDTTNLCYYESKAYTEGATRDGQVCSRLVNTQPVRWVTRT
ncbi:DUF1496 domain-containing protein (plasmid) [Dyella sp. BiH032]|uniref:DUF1496 domain-containing protein n=1 Tax=Dyella sp. BiH032 TaxID=3075430 RepID=UPI0028936BD3|nr:DUF1496 domain-containing protein [Dyella sp. BiH032]WNL48474.1 DUF1496 domain-containing protein [Dyella sp. BiH032]